MLGFGATPKSSVQKDKTHRRGESNPDGQAAPGGRELRIENIAGSTIMYSKWLSGDNKGLAGVFFLYMLKLQISS
jgi:hypothetical protein